MSSQYLCDDVPPPPVLSDCVAVSVVEVQPSVWNLTSEEGSAISLAVVGVWVVGWVFRQIARVIRET